MKVFKIRREPVACCPNENDGKIYYGRFDPIGQKTCYEFGNYGSIALELDEPINTHLLYRQDYRSIRSVCFVLSTGESWGKNFVIDRRDLEFLQKEFDSMLLECFVPFQNAWDNL